MIIQKDNALIFLALYKHVLSSQLDSEPSDAEDFVEARELIFEDQDYLRDLASANKNSPQKIRNFFISLSKAIYTDFLFYRNLKNYAVLIALDTKKVYYVKGITDPVSDLAPVNSIIKTVIMSYHDDIVCDGLIQNSNTSIGPNMLKEFDEIYKSAKLNNEIQLNMDGGY